MSADPINRPGETIPEAEARYALTDAMSAAYREEWLRWRYHFASRETYFYTVMREGKMVAENCTPDLFALFDQYRERGAMGAALLIAEKGLK
jgi:hypothetical protein